MRLGVPIGVTMVFEVALFNAATLAMGTFGLSSLAAHQIAITIPSLTFMIPLGIGLAATVRVGLAAGAGDRDRGAARRLHRHRHGRGLHVRHGTAVARLPQRQSPACGCPICRPMPMCWRWRCSILHVAAAFQLMDGLQVTASMSLRGLKDARWPMWLAGASYWLAGAPMCALLAFGFGLKGLGIWLGLAFGLSVAALSLTARFAWLSRVRA